MQTGLRNPTERARAGAHTPPTWGTSEASYQLLCGLIVLSRKTRGNDPNFREVLRRLKK